MIFGIGTDLCDAGRMEKSLTRQSFVNHVFSPQEQDQLNTLHGKHRAESAAANFAAKEAFLKAAGTGLGGFALPELGRAAPRKRSAVFCPDRHSLRVGRRQRPDRPCQPEP